MLENCEVKKVRCSDELEIMCNRSTTCNVSSSKIRLDAPGIRKKLNLQLFKQYSFYVRVISASVKLIVEIKLKKQDLVM